MPRLPVMLDTWITWNAAGQISQYDATFRWFDYLVSTLFGLASSNGDHCPWRFDGATQQRGVRNA